MSDSQPVRQILNSLLDRFEQPGRQRVVRVRLDPREHQEYFTEREILPRRTTNAALQELAQQGILQLHWARWEEGNWLTAVDLLPGGAEVLYARLGRKPRGERELVLQRLLTAQTPRRPWHAAFLEWAKGQLAAHRSVAPLSLDDPRTSADLLRALDALAQLNAPILQRTLSVRLFADSKRLEEFKSALVGVLRRFDPDAATYGEDDWAMLNAHQLMRVPEYVPLAGPLRLQVQGASLDLAPFVPSVALSATTLRAALVGNCSAHVLVTVENATSFNELVTAAPPGRFLMLYTGGFASPSVVAFLQTVRAACPELAFYHWGDLDVGGLRILAHLRKQLGRVAPLAMDVSTFEVFRTQGQALSAAERSSLLQLRSVPLLADCSDLIDCLLTAGLKLEQEAVDPQVVIAVLGVRESNL